MTRFSGKTSSDNPLTDYGGGALRWESGRTCLVAETDSVTSRPAFSFEAVTVHQATHVGICTATGKRMYLDRKTAVKIGRLHHEHLSAYRCDDCGHWHLGHLAQDILRGRETRTDRYRPVRHARDDDLESERLDELRALREALATGRRRVRGVSRDEAVARVDGEIGRVVAGAVGV